MLALTICQPYAELIARGEKVIENRTWPTNYRGRIAIHAGKSRDWLEEGDEQAYPDMPFGAVVATAELYDCVRWESLPDDLKENIHANGPWCFLLRDIRRLDPIPCSGKQGFWTFIHPLVLAK